MVEVKQVQLSKATALGIKIMGHHGKPLAVLIKAPKGFITCANFDVQSMEEKGVTAATVAGINSVETAMETTVVHTTAQARELGITEGMPVREALEKLC